MVGEPDRRGVMPDLQVLRAAIAAAMMVDASVPGGPAVAVGRACVAGLPVDGGAFTMMSSDAARQTLMASDDAIAAVEHCQFSLGEGPSLQAFATGRPVLLSDVKLFAPGRWPVFSNVVADLPIGGLYTLPMQLGAISVGVCVLYRREPGALDRHDLALMLAAIDITTHALLALRATRSGEQLTGSPIDLGADWPATNGRDRRQIHQATGMLIGQLGVPAEEAFARLRAYAFAHSQSIDDVAENIVKLRLQLQNDPT